MHRSPQGASFSRRALIVGVACVVLITVLGMHYSTIGVTLCATRLAPVAPAPSSPVVLFKPILPFAQAIDVATYLQQHNAKVGVELGIQNGAFSAAVLKIWTTPIKYYMVDEWKPQPNYRDFANVGANAQERLFKQVKRDFAQYKGVAHVIRKNTQAAAKELPGNMDFVYIDARRDYCAVSKDIATYWKKLKVGGIMGGGAYVEEGPPGTDWSICADGKKHNGAVKRAVNEFVTKHNLQLMVTYEHQNLPSWFVQKTMPDSEDTSEDSKEKKEKEKKDN